MPTEVIPIRLEMVNAFILRGPSGYILVDAGIPGMSGRILEAMRTHGLAPRAAPHPDYPRAPRPLWQRGRGAGQDRRADRRAPG